MVGNPLLPSQIGLCEAHGMKTLREMLWTVPKIPVSHSRHKGRFLSVESTTTKSICAGVPVCWGMDSVGAPHPAHPQPLLIPQPCSGSSSMDHWGQCAGPSGMGKREEDGVEEAGEGCSSWKLGAGSGNTFGWELCALELPLPVLWEDPSGDGGMGVGFQKGSNPSLVREDGFLAGGSPIQKAGSGSPEPTLGLLEKGSTIMWQTPTTASLFLVIPACHLGSEGGQEH